MADASKTPLSKPSQLKSDVWNHFGFKTTPDKELDKTKVVCKICQAEVSYCRNTTNLRNHLTRYHTMLTLASDNKPSGAKQKKLRESLKLPADSPRAIKITEAIATFVCKDLRPYSVVENEGFRRLLQVLEPHYVMVQRKHLTETVIPMMYTCVKDDILTKMQSAERVAITCDTWTSLSTQSYMTVTSHYIDNEWCLMSHVLQTTEVLTSHTAINIADMLTGAIQEWGLTSKDPAVVTDNAANMVRAVEIMQLMHVGCFAHTLNLASQAGLKVPAVSRLLAQVRRIATFFHRNTMANHILKEKQKLLQLPAHKLTVDVVTRWNSALDMLERFLEQQPAISATLLSQDVRRNEKDLCTLTEEDVTIAEDLVRVLKPMKEATLAMSEDKQPTLSVIAPLLALLQEALTPSIEDSTVVRDLKAAAKNNLRTRYDAQKDILYAASALDPRFKALPFLSAKEQDDTFSRLQTEAATAARDQNTDGNDADEGAEEMGEATSPKKPKKSSTLESLLGAVYLPTAKENGHKTPAMKAGDEIRRYRAEQPEENAVAEEASKKRGGAKDAGPHTMSNAKGHISLTMRIASYVMSSFIA
ncbi:E3 SUMO-protein ligase ZBED1-like [Acanthopagrus schlegelii]